MTQSHLIVKEEGICIYRVPDGSEFAENFQDGSGTGRYDEQGYQEAVKQAQSSAILCEDQERATELAIKNGAYVCMEVGKPLLEIGSIYPVPGIEFSEIEVGCARHESTWQCKHNDCKEILTVARLIEHTAEKESPEIDKEEHRPTVATFEGHVLLLLQEFQEAHDEYQNNVSDTKINPNGENTGYFSGKADAYGYAARQIRSMLRWHGKIDSDHP